VANAIGTNAIGTSFPAELQAAGLLGLPFSWGADGSFQFDAKMTATQIAAVQAVYAKHNPNTPATDQVDQFRDNRLAAGFADTGTGGTGKTWQCDPSSVGNWTALAAQAQPWALNLVTTDAPSFQVWGTDNQIITLTAAQVYALFAQRVMPWVSATMAYARTMKTNIAAGNPPADITQGWP
jgi:hypothetical protein